MNAERLLQHYEQIADAPDAIARLRRFILDLAVRGKLVPQDFAEEPASELLKRIAAEKARLVKTGTIRKEKMLPPLSSAGGAFELPDKWAWARLGQLAQLVTSGSRDWAKHYSNEGAIFVRMGNLSKDHYRLRLDHVQRVKAPDDGEGTRTRLETGDILISITGDVGMLGLIPEGFGEAYINQHTAMVRPVAELRGRYLAELFRSPFAQQQFNEPQRGIKNSFRLSDVTEFVVPLPPLAEQHRIVAKVDELMALCDELEVARMERETKRDRLAAASLARLNTPDPETFHDDARFALDALPALTARPDQIKQLRQTILNLAVRGKLVPQDPTDEPAQELYAKVERWRLYEIGRKNIRAPRKPLLPIEKREFPYERPQGWMFARLGSLIYIQSGDGLTAANMTGGPFPVFGGNGVNGYHDHHNVDKPRIVIGRVGYYCGSVHVTPEKAWVTDNAFITHFPEDLIELRFLVLLLNATNLKEEENATAQPVISGSKIYPLVVGLPPLVEQHRIVAKVDELMALCDQLETSLTSADETRKKLLDALLAEALAPVDAEALQEAAE
ncbi:restriction endonuclease subunit S [Agrobacterium vitis]|uniref:restriction endonuclease subunit S n=1 Tax=Agrobacterium vitis TaxID=373 RepID=UPI0012E789C0|nr:restriction endonuclease subunit S [Agrobacterium vitis]MVA63167.1 restriction endonuclease subunit S [Agrobacterium vitis]